MWSRWRLLITCILFLNLLLVPGASLGDAPAEGSVDSSIAFAGGDGSPSNPYQISNVTHLQNMSSDLSASYVLVNDINASPASSWNAGSGFDPIGDSTPQGEFKGTFDGKNHTINGLYIFRRGEDYVGLFGVVDSSGTIQNVRLENLDITGSQKVGGLVGQCGADVNRCYSTGKVRGFWAVGLTTLILTNIPCWVRYLIHLLPPVSVACLSCVVLAAGLTVLPWFHTSLSQYHIWGFLC